MNLTRSAWKRQSQGDTHDDYIQILPEAGFIVTYTSIRPNTEKTLIWGLWIREMPDSVVYTAHKNGKSWRRESYKIQGHQLIWNNGSDHGDAIWDLIDNSSIPHHLQEMGAAFIEKFARLHPPEFISAEQAAPRNR